MTIIHLEKAGTEFMRHWERIRHRKDEWKIFWNNHVPNHLKTPEPGKFAIYAAGGEQIYLSNHEDATVAHMIVEVSKGDKNNDEYIKILHEENVIPLGFHVVDSWLYSPVTNKLAGKSIAITGVTTFPREVYQSLIDLNGGTYRSMVGKKTTHLINTHSEESTKIKRAREHGVQLINEADFFKMIA
jgi:NAD-dependent DNA ligase